jgi:PAS domain-containing protein
MNRFDYVNAFHPFSTNEHSLLLVFARILVNISQRKKSEEELRKALEVAEDNKEMHRFLFENMTQGVVYHSSTGEVIYANKAASRILGLTSDQLFGKTSFDPSWRSIREDGSDYPGELHPAIITLKTSKEVRNEVMGVFSPNENSYVWININSIPKYKPGQKKPYQVVVT